MAPDVFFDRYIADDFERVFVPKRFESLCRQFLIRQNRQGRLPEIFDAIGTYSYDLPKEHKNGAFDVVTHDDKGYIFYEAKFQQTPITDAMIETEIRQVRQTGMDCYRYGFFSCAGYEVTSRPDVILYTLDDLFESC